MPSFSIGYVSRKYLRAKYKAERLAYMKEQRCVQTQKSKDEKNKKRRTGVIMDEREKSMIQGMVCVWTQGQMENRHMMTTQGLPCSTSSVRTVWQQDHYYQSVVNNNWHLVHELPIVLRWYMLSCSGAIGLSLPADDLGVGVGVLGGIGVLRTWVDGWCQINPHFQRSPEYFLFITLQSVRKVYEPKW